MLFVCTANQQRSPTAETMYRDDPASTPVIVLGIPDVYGYMEQSLQREIRSRFEAALPG